VSSVASDLRTLVIATKNPRKARELSQIMTGLPFRVVSISDYPYAPEVEEDAATFAGNAVKKAVEYAAFTGELTLADDSGLEVDALDGAPGVLSSRFAETDEKRIARVLDLLEDVPDARRTARFRCVAAIAWPDGRCETREGSVEGVIAHQPSGEHGFGYDPIFYVTEMGKTMAELLPEEKNPISHRAAPLPRSKTC